ncbi:MAG: hypothetical protein AAFV53_00265 [Myxococcota bacterium]
MPVTYADYVNSGRIAAILNPLLHENLYDAVGLRRFMTFYPYTAGGSTTMNVTTVTRGYSMAAASSETSGGFTATDPTANQFQLTVALHGLLMRATDLFKVTGPGAALDVDYLLSLLLESLDLTLTDLMAGLFASVSGNVGQSGVDASADDLYDAVYYLRLNNNISQDRMAILHGQQVNNLQESIRNERGAIEYTQQTQNAVQATGRDGQTGYAFSHAGVDVYQCGSVPTATAGADRQGCVMAPGAFAYTLGGVALLGQEMVNPQDIIAGTNEMFIERSRDAGNSQTDFYAKAYPAVTEAEDLRAVKITTDA